jgi:hypothetical protein
MGALEIHTLLDATKFYVLMVLDSLECHLASTVADGIVDLAKSAASSCPLDSVAL